ncbi:MAG TPA: ATP-binding protein [Ferrovibrio sp.]|jgi:signal transduction histidine kinase|uniref:sensor histidine kinase n=1 Tax=Ferrovibrio sp. TaxID=1917215 RepID=UPI002ED6B2A5
MLDLKTILIILVVNASLQGIVWLFVWVSQRHLYELTLIASAYIVFAIGLVLIIMRGPAPPAWHIVLDNTLVNTGLILAADGLARFLNQRRFPLVNIGVVAFSVAFWSLALALDPTNVAIRTHATALVTITAVAIMIRTLAFDRTQPRFLRWTTIAFLVEHAAATISRAWLTAQDQTSLEMPAADNTTQALYFFEINVFVTIYFLCLLLMVGLRLSSDLRQKNEALSNEVAERRKLQEQLSASLAAEKALRSEQHQLLRMVSHEFRTPLAIVDRAAEMIDVVLDKPPETVSKRLTSIREAVQRLLLLIDRFLDSERRQAELVQPKRIAIASLFARVQRHFASMDAGHQLTFAADRTLPFYWGDPEMLATVLIILIDNAIKYSPDASPIEIAARSDDGAITISVTDHGIGIPADELDSVGRRFFRASNTKPATGTGLGLHSARQLLGYHRGMLNVHNGPDGGTVASVRLPLPGLTPSRRSAEDREVA